jgi:hypothetical protein
VGAGAVGLAAHDAAGDDPLAAAGDDDDLVDDAHRVAAGDDVAGADPHDDLADDPRRDDDVWVAGAADVRLAADDGIDDADDRDHNDHASVHRNDHDADVDHDDTDGHLGVDAPPLRQRLSFLPK